MPRPNRTGDSDGSDNDVDAQEKELADLERKYRLQVNDKKAFTQESQDIIKKQRAEIEQLERERSELETDLRLIESKSNKERDDRQCENLSDLGRQKNECEQALEKEREKQQKLDAEIRELERSSQRGGQGGEGSSGGGGGGGGSGVRGGGGSSKGQRGAGGGVEKAGSAKDRQRKLEDQLQLANNKFGKLLESNKALREEIDDLRVERQRFDNLHKKLVKEKEELQKQTREVIDQSTQAHDQRVEAQEKMLMLKEKSDKEIQQYDTEMKELTRVISHEEKLELFMSTKGSNRDEDAQLVAWRQRKEMMEAEKKKANQTDSVESYEEAFERIRHVTQEEDITHIVNRFIEAEDKNFALFNFVNDQNNKAEQLQEHIQKIKEDIRTFKSEGVQMDAKRQAMLKELEEEQTRASKEAEGYNKRNKELNKILDQAKAGIGSLFTKISCERTAIDEMLGTQEGVTDQNVLQHLGIIEERTNQLLLAQAYLIAQDNYEEYKKRQPSLLGTGPGPQQQPPTLFPPAVYIKEGLLRDDLDNGDESDDESRPLTRDELTLRAMKAVKKREAGTKKQPYDTADTHSADKTRKKDKSAKQSKTTVAARA